MFLAIPIIAAWVANEGADALPRCSTHIVGLIHDVEEGGDGFVIRWGRVTGQARRLAREAIHTRISSKARHTLGGGSRGDCDTRGDARVDGVGGT